MSALVDGFSPITLPVFYQAVPLDIEGQGPASNEDTVSVAHEVWDVMRTICVCGNEKTARELVSLLAELTTLQSRLEAVEAERDAMRTTGWRVALEFHPGDEIPDVPRGNMKACVIMLRSKHTGKNFTLPAYYLNAYPLEFENGCGDEKCEGEHDDGCPVTGWFYDNANFEYENCYYRIEGECLAWAFIPASPEIEAAAPARTEEGKP